MREKSNRVARSRRFHVKQAMIHAWNDGYKKYAWGMDEVKPISKTGENVWGGMATTMLDSLDTLWLMGLEDEFRACRDWIQNNATFLAATTNTDVSVFETTIRSLGGLLSAHDLSGDDVFLDKAKELGSRLFPAFDSPSGIPYGIVNLESGEPADLGWTGGNAVLAEATTLQVEYRYLAKVSGRRDYAVKSERVYKILNEISPSNGLFPHYLKILDEQVSFGNDVITFGAMGDSFYEYMLKMWLQGGRKEDLYRNMYDRSIQGMHDELLQVSHPSGLYYIADKSDRGLHRKMDHLVCFMGGLLALGAYTDPQGLASSRAQRDLKAGRALTYTCYQMYARATTGLSPEFVRFAVDENNDFVSGNSNYLLRPEAVESFFVLHHLTGDPVYREWGWEVFCAIERFCRTEIAYGQLGNVEDPFRVPENKMESFFLAETLKYLYLLFDPDTEIDLLNKHVFNTEAHPLRILPLLDAVQK